MGTRDALPAALAAPLEKFVGEMKEMFGERLRAAVLYGGGGASGGW